MIERFSNNPLITPSDVKPYHEDSTVIGAFNAGVAYHEGEYILLLRIAEKPNYKEGFVSTWVFDNESNEVVLKTYDENDDEYNFEDPRTIRKADNLVGFVDLTSISYLRIARSKDGKNFSVDNKPFIYPNSFETEKGIEDARISKINDVYYITYSQVSSSGITVGLSKTADFKASEYCGAILAADNKDVVLFPEKINGKYHMLHRPMLNDNIGLNIWAAESPDLLHWGNHQYLLGTRDNSFESARIGAGSPPIKTKDGWLEIYHGATKDHRYCTGAILFDLNDPRKILYRSAVPIFEPEMEYERKGFFGDVVFVTGMVRENENQATIYYGVSDTSIAGATLNIDKVLEFLKENSL